MSTQKDALISVNLKEGVFTISGSETFVESNKQYYCDFIENNKDYILKLNSVIESRPQQMIFPSAKEQTPKQQNAEVAGTIEKTKYIRAGIYRLDENGNVTITKKVPGNNKAERTRNIALIVLHAKGEKIQGKDIQYICKKQSCYDSNNFSLIFRNDLNNFVREGNGQTWTLELTNTGEKAAIMLLDRMLNED